MKLFKKLMSVMLAGVLAVGVLAGCSGGGNNANDPVPAGPRPEDPDVLAVYEAVEQKVTSMQFVSAPAYSEEASKLAEVYLNNGSSTAKTTAFNELQATLKEQGLLVVNASDVELTGTSSLRYTGPCTAWTSVSDITSSQTNTMLAGLLDWRCNSVGIAVKDGKMAIVYLRIIEIPTEAN